MKSLWGSLLVTLFGLCQFGCSRAGLWHEHVLPAAGSSPYGQHYMVWLPQDYAKDAHKQWPVIVALHGQGEWGHDLERVRSKGLAQYLNEGHQLPAIVLVPQTPQNQLWHPLFVDAVMKDAARRYRFDDSRLYLTGLSMGGIGSWNMAMAYPHRFAAMAPIAASLLNDIYMDRMGLELGAATLFMPFLQRIGHLPVWVFHGDRDTVVPTELGQRSASLFKQAGGSPKTTIYRMTEHDSWSATYFDNPAFYEWLFQQRNAAPRWDEAAVKIDTAAYTGQYVNDKGELRAVVSVADGRLSLKWITENKEGQLIALDSHRFVGTGLVQFGGEGGHMQTLSLTGAEGLRYQAPSPAAKDR